MRLRRPSARDGGRLRSRLLALTMLPLIGLAAAATVQVGEQAQSSRASADAERFVRAVGVVNKVRAAFGDESGPTYVDAILTHLELLKASAFVTSDLNGLISRAGRYATQVPALRAETDKAIAQVIADPTVAEAGRRFATEVAMARTEVDDAGVGTTGMSNREMFLTDLSETENDEIAAATQAGLGIEAMHAVRDVADTALAVQSAAAEFELFFATKFAAAGDPIALRENWVKGWGEYTARVGSLLTSASPPVADRWQQADQDSRVSELNAYLSSDIAAPFEVTLDAAISQLLLDGPRDRVYAKVLDFAVHRAEQQARLQHDHATVVLAWLIVLCALLILATVAGAVLVRRSVSIPLEKLAEQATHISEGDLIDIHVGGPQEVRTVARALASSVATLRTIEAQAAAVAEGRLDDPVVRNPLPGALGQAVHASVSGVADAIKEREQAQTELAHRAAHDALTELPNRAQAQVFISHALHRAQRSGDKTALMFVDLDRFKAVNDTLGHAAGDEVLQQAARRMVATVRDSDIVARLGGDEFVILIEDSEDEADVVRLAERVIAALSEVMTIGSAPVRIGASIGVAVCRDGYVDGDRLLREADAAAYRAKRDGRGRVEVFDDHLRSQLERRGELEDALAAGLANDEFVLYYQPVVALETRTPVAVEALIRWNRPGHGLVMPDEFIPVAEQSSLINDIGRWVLRTATAQLAEWHRTGAQPPWFRMSVNISGRHLAAPEIVADVQVALEHSGIEPSRLTVELTESVLINDVVATRNMELLRGLGVCIAIDDFGTGFTSIGQLPRLPVDVLKIDRSFVASLDPAHQELVRLIVAAAHAFGLLVVAEGIEHEHQAASLQSIRADIGQGYLFARPQPASDLFPQQVAFESITR